MLLDFSWFTVFRLFTEICKEAGDCDEILFNPNGSWNPLGAPGKDAQPVGQVSSRKAPAQSISTTIHLPTTISPVKGICKY